MTGPGKVFEGRLGFFNLISHKPTAPLQLGEPFGIRRAFTKRFPLGQFSQTAAQAAVEARQFVRNPDEIHQHSGFPFRDQDHGRQSGQVATANP